MCWTSSKESWKLGRPLLLLPRQQCPQVAERKGMGKAISAASVSCSVKLASLGFSCAHAHPPQIETSIGGESRIGGGGGLGKKL